MTLDALGRFNDTEALRSKQKDAGQPVAPRLLLKLVGRGSNIHLEARDDTRLERLKTVFMRKDYKLENIKEFISKLPFQEATVATTFINKKIEARKPTFSLFALFQKAIFGKTEIDAPKDPFKDAPPTNPLFVASPLTQTVPNALFGEPEPIQPKVVPKEIQAVTDKLSQKPTPRQLNQLEKQLTKLEKKFPENIAEIQAARKTIGELRVNKPLGHGMENPNTACYLNSTSQALRQSPSFKEFLQTRRHELEQILGETSPDVTPEKLQIEVKAFSDLIYDKAKTDLPLAIYFVQEYQDESDYAKAIVQLALINKLQEIYTKLDSDTVDENTVQSFRSLIIASGFIDVGTNLSSQEDASSMLAHLLRNIGAQPFTYTNAISYQSSFAIPMLDRQGNEQSVFPIALMDVVPNTTIQDLVVERKVDETIEKNDIINREDFLVRNPDEMEEILNLQDKITVPTTQTLLFAKGQEPKLLPVTLKRYNFTEETGPTKNKVAINPSLTLEVPIVGQNEVARYRLTAVTVHQGSSLKSGHFYTYATQPEGSWAEYNDSRVTARTNEVALDDIKHNAYVYYYEYVDNIPSEATTRGRTQARA